MLSVSRLYNPYAGAAVVTLLLQQLIVASSTYWIAQLAMAWTQRSEQVVWYAGAFIASLILVYVPSTFSFYWLEKAKVVTSQRVIQQFLNRILGKIALSIDQNSRQSKEQMLIHESLPVIEDLFHSVYDLLALILNVVCTLSILSYVIDSTFALGYGLAFILMAIGAKLVKKPLTTTTATWQKTRTRFLSLLQHAWQVFTIHNPYNTQAWQTEFNAESSRFMHAVSKRQLITQLSAAGAVLCGLLPLCLVVVFNMSRLTIGDSLGLVMIATLPRQLQLVQNLDNLFSAIIYTQASYLRWKNYCQIANQECVPALIERLHMEEMTITAHGSDTPIPIADFLEHLPTQGRFCIRGKNGCGKSTLLALLKERLQERAYLLPSTVDLYFTQLHQQGHSAGEKVLQAFSEIQHLSVGYFLLDEWDANLDLTHVEQLSNTLNLLSKKTCIIEVRHRL